MQKLIPVCQSRAHSAGAAVAMVIIGFACWLCGRVRAGSRQPSLGDRWFYLFIIAQRYCNNWCVVLGTRGNLAHGDGEIFGGAHPLSEEEPIKK